MLLIEAIRASWAAAISQAHLGLGTNSITWRLERGYLQAPYVQSCHVMLSCVMLWKPREGLAVISCILYYCIQYYTVLQYDSARATGSRRAIRSYELWYSTVKWVMVDVRVWYIVYRIHGRIAARRGSDSEG
jgi:hypothetical protein